MDLKEEARREGGTQFAPNQCLRAPSLLLLVQRSPSVGTRIQYYCSSHVLFLNHISLMTETSSNSKQVDNDIPFIPCGHAHPG